MNPRHSSLSQSHTIGQIKSYHQNGGLFIACNKNRLDEYTRLATLGKAFGIESFVVSPAEAKKIHPLVAVDDVYGAMYSPTDGTIDPAGVGKAFVNISNVGIDFFIVLISTFIYL
jgi:glycine/D-amino acid oxidase-like deaminating enzyme